MLRRYSVKLILDGLGLYITFLQRKVLQFFRRPQYRICNDKYRLIYLKDTTNKGRLKTVPEIEETDIFRRP